MMLGSRYRLINQQMLEKLSGKSGRPYVALVIAHAARSAFKRYNGPQKLDRSLSYNSVSGSLEIGEGKYDDTEREEAV